MSWVGDRAGATSLKEGGNSDRAGTTTMRVHDDVGLINE